MPHYRVREASALLGVSDDTVRRWIDSGTLPAEKDEVGRLIIEGATLAEFSRSHAATPEGSGGRRGTGSSAWSPR